MTSPKRNRRSGRVRNPGRKGIRMENWLWEEVSYIAGANDFTLTDPKEVGKGEDLSADVDDSLRGLAFSSGISDGHGRVVADKGDGVS